MLKLSSHNIWTSAGMHTWTAVVFIVRKLLASDDIFYYKVQTLMKFKLRLRSDINKTQRWCVKNNMAINPTKPLV